MAIIIVVGSVTVFEIRDVESEAERTVAVAETNRVLNDLSVAVADQVLSIRGLLLSGDRDNIARYQEAGGRFDRAMLQAVERLTGTEGEGRLASLKGHVVAWRRDVAERQIALMRKPLTVDEARVIESNGAGSDFLAATDAEIQALLQQGAEPLASSQSAMASAFSVTFAVSLIGALVSTGLAAAGWLVLARSIVVPVAGLTTVMGRLTEGDLGADIPGAGRGDELGRMARAVQVFKDGIAENRRLTEEQRRAADEKLARAEEVARLIARFEADSADMLAKLAEHLKERLGKERYFAIRHSVHMKLIDALQLFEVFEATKNGYYIRLAR